MLYTGSSEPVETEEERQERIRKADADLKLFWARLDLARRMKDEIMRGDHDNLLNGLDS